MWKTQKDQENDFMEERSVRGKADDKQLIDGEEKDKKPHNHLQICVSS